MVNFDVVIRDCNVYKNIAEFEANEVLSLGEKTLNFTAAYICNTTSTLYKSLLSMYRLFPWTTS